MRTGNRARRAARWIGAAVIMASVSALETSVALAAGNSLFPVKPGLVPLLVAAVFVAPALAAAVWSSVRRATGRFANAVALMLLVMAAAGVTVYARPELLSAIRV